MKIGIDLDGTILTCKPRHVNVLYSILKSHELFVDMEGVWEMKQNGMSTFDALKNYLKDEKLAKHISETWISLIESPFYLNFDTIIPRAQIKILDWLNHGYELHLISARSYPKL